MANEVTGISKFYDVSEDTINVFDEIIRKKLLNEVAFQFIGNDSQKVVIKFLNGNVKTTGDSVKCRYSSACGFSPYKTLTLSNTAVGTSAPAKPASITIAIVDTTICGGRKYRYTAPTLPVATAVYAAATEYAWILPTTNIGAVLDSGTLTSKVIVVRYTSNRAAVTGDSMYLKYNSACGFSPIKGQKLTNLLKSNCPTARMISYTSTSYETQGWDVQTYPNPVKDIINLKIDGLTTDKISIKIIDIHGRVLKTMMIESHDNSQINVSDLTTGNYFIEVKQGQKVKMIKVFKEK